MCQGRSSSDTRSSDRDSGCSHGSQQREEPHLSCQWREFYDKRFMHQKGVCENRASSELDNLYREGISSSEGKWLGEANL